MSDQQQTTEQASPSAAGPFASVVGTVIGGILGLLVLVLAVSLLDRPPTGSIQELPHAVIVLDLPDQGLHLSTARQMLVALEKRLAESGLTLLGPASYPILVPPERPGDAPTARSLADISNEELERALPYFGAGGWLSPRLYAADARLAVIRLAPPGRGGFPPGSRGTIERTVTEALTLNPGARAWIYSRALGMEDDEARNQANAWFGVQTASVLLRSPGRRLLSRDVYDALHRQLEKLKDPHLRSVTTLSSWATYYAAVTRHEPQKAHDTSYWADAMARAKDWNLPPMVDPLGTTGTIEVCTDAEGETNLEVANLIAAHLDAEGVMISVPRQRP